MSRGPTLSPRAEFALIYDTAQQAGAIEFLTLEVAGIEARSGNDDRFAGFAVADILHHLDAADFGFFRTEGQARIGVLVVQGD